MLAAGCAAETVEEEEDDSVDALSGVSELLQRYKKFVIVVMENRSFDHYFGHLSLAKADGGEGRTTVNGFSTLAAHTNPDLAGKKIPIFQPTGTELGDIDHNWEACHEQFGAGKMDGFVRAHQRDLIRLNDKDDLTKPICLGTTTDDKVPVPKCGDPNDPMAFYTRKHTPVYHQLLDEYVLCDNWFASVMGPTWPNRFYLHAATAGGRKTNKPLFGIGSEARNSIFGAVSSRERGIRRDNRALGDESRLCVNFFTDVPLLPIMFPTLVGQANGPFLPNFNYGHLMDKPRTVAQEALSAFTNGKVFGGSIPDGFLDLLASARFKPTFETLAREGKLPPVTYIEPPFMLAPMDDHPPHDVLAGQAFISSIYKMLQNSPDWEHTLLIVTYDEHGSFYDHVKPPIVREDENPEFQQLGFRVPSLVIGKGVKRNHVSKVQYDHCSILSTLTNRFDLRPSNDRVKTAKPLFDCISGSASQSAGASGGLELKRVQLSESQVLRSAQISAGQKEIAEKVFRNNVPFEAKRIFTNQMFELFDRLGVADIRP